MIVTYERYLGGTWLITAEHDSGALLDALVQTDFDWPEMVSWLRGKDWPHRWKIGTQIERSAEWLSEHEGDEFVFPENVDVFMENAPFRFAPVMDDVPPMPESWFNYFYVAELVNDEGDMDEDYLFTVLPNGTVKPGYDYLLGTRFYEVDYNKTKEMYLG